MSGYTKGPWCVWDGPAYVGGGRDLCIGAGDTWLANMDQRQRLYDAARGLGLRALKLDSDTNICELGTGVAMDDDGWSDEITAEQRANANLIAAAPDLYEALLALFEADDDDMLEAREQAAAALRKAGGE